jgi:hypothetical protein
MTNLTESFDLIKWIVWFGFYCLSSRRTGQPIRAGIADHGASADFQIHRSNGVAGSRPGGRGTFLQRGKKVPKETRPAAPA